MGADAISQYLRGQLATATQDRLDAYAGGPDPDLHAALVVDLNRSIRSGSSLYAPQRFEGVALSSPTTALLAETLSGESAPTKYRQAVICRLNRLLVEARPGLHFNQPESSRAIWFCDRGGSGVGNRGASSRGGLRRMFFPPP